MMRPTLDTHPDDGVLHDLVDGLLSPDDRAAAEAHVARCAACAAQLERLRRLLAVTAELPREIAPDADGWPLLRSRLSALGSRPDVGRLHASGSRTRSWMRRPRRAALLAAALLLGAIGAWGAWRGGVPSAGTPGAAAQAEAGTGGDAAASFAAVERDYARAAAELTAELDATRDRLPARVAASLDRSLATIDTALVEARSALARDPGNPELVRFVAASYEHKLDLLRRSTAITSGD